MTVVREVSVHGRLDEPRSVPIKAVDNGDGTYSLAVNVSSNNAPSQKGILLDHSGEITNDNASQQVMPANADRKYLLIQNVSAISLWINFNTDAVTSQPSVELVADGSFDMEGTFICTQSISIIGITASSAFVAKEGI